jgi:hypothetical protein
MARKGGKRKGKWNRRDSFHFGSVGYCDRKLLYLVSLFRAVKIAYTHVVPSLSLSFPLCLPFSLALSLGGWFFINSMHAKDIHEKVDREIQIVDHHV